MKSSNSNSVTIDYSMFEYLGDTNNSMRVYVYNHSNSNLKNFKIVRTVLSIDRSNIFRCIDIRGQHKTSTLDTLDSWRADAYSSLISNLSSVLQDKLESYNSTKHIPLVFGYGKYKSVFVVCGVP